MRTRSSSERQKVYGGIPEGFEAGAYLPVYQRSRPASLENIPMARKELFHRRDHTNGALFASRDVQTGAISARSP